MSRLIIFILAIAFANSSYAKTNKKVILKNVAPYFLIQSERSHNFKDLTFNVFPDKKTQKKVLKFLKKNKALQLPVPHVQMKNRQLEFSYKGYKFVTPYSMHPIPYMKIGTKIINIKQNTTIQDLFNDIHSATATAQNLNSPLGHFIPKAHATSPDVMKIFGIASSFGAYIAKVQWGECVDKEAGGDLSCALKSKAGFIKAIVNHKGDLASFTCDGKNLVEATEVGTEGKVPYKDRWVYKYNENRLIKLDVKRTKNDIEKLSCSYAISSKMKVKVLNKGSVSCDMEDGARLRFLGQFPHRRLMGCCEDKECVQEVNDHIAQLNGVAVRAPSSAPKKTK